MRTNVGNTFPARSPVSPLSRPSLLNPLSFQLFCSRKNYNPPVNGDRVLENSDNGSYRSRKFQTGPLRCQLKPLRNLIFLPFFFSGITLKHSCFSAHLTTGGSLKATRPLRVLVSAHYKAIPHDKKSRTPPRIKIARLGGGGGLAFRVALTSN